MRVQSASFTITGNNCAHVGKEVGSANNTPMGNKVNKNNNTSATNLVVSSNSQFDKMIENIQEQIQKIQENDHYDTDTKKSKIEELEKHLGEIEKVKAEQLNESVFGQKKKSNNNTNKSNIGGVILDLSINAKALLEADNSLKSLQSAHATKVKLEGESNVLASEIKIDKGRGIDTSEKEEQLAKIKEGVEKSFKNFGKSVNDINESISEISESTQTVIVNSIDKKEDSAKLDTSNSTTTDSTVQKESNKSNE